MSVLGFWDVVAKVVASVTVAGVFLLGAVYAVQELSWLRRRVRIRRAARARRGWLDGRARL